MSAARSSPNLCIGTYDKSGGEGLYPVTLATDGTMSCGKPFAGARNASFAAADRNGRWFIVDEMAGTIGLYARAEDWRLEHRFLTGGKEPCYVAVDPAGRVLAAANYGTGSAALWRLDDDGMPLGPSALMQSRGSGPVADRQDGPHCHCTAFGPDGAGVYVTDLGADAILRVTLQGMRAQAETAYAAPAGSGPRHLLFTRDGPRAVLLSELASTLTTFSVDDKRLRPIATCSTLPDDFEGESLGGHLALGGNGLIYASNRGHDSLAVFSLDADGRPNLVQHVASGGSSPRHFLLLEDQALLVVAHENDGTVASFRIGEDGRLAATGHSISVPGSCFALRI